MSQENVEIIRDGVASLNVWNTSEAGDVQELLCRLLHQDVEWHDQSEPPGASGFASRAIPQLGAIRVPTD
jgi:hypothetical protein